MFSCMLLNRLQDVPGITSIVSLFEELLDWDQRAYGWVSQMRLCT